MSPSSRWLPGRPGRPPCPGPRGAAAAVRWHGGAGGAVGRMAAAGERSPGDGSGPLVAGGGVTLPQAVRVAARTRIAPVASRMAV